MILSASGMCEAGRVRHHLKHNLWRPECTILFVGYQAAGTTGRAILDGKKKIELFGEEIEVDAEIRFLPGKSGHADKNGLLRWIGAFDPKPAMVFVNHGDDAVARAYANCLVDEHGFEATAPYSGAVFDLLAGCYTEAPEGVPVTHRTAKQQRVDSVFDALIAAVERLGAAARACKGIPNKEIARFTGQVNSLTEKWSTWAQRKAKGGKGKK